MVLLGGMIGNLAGRGTLSSGLDCLLTDKSAYMLITAEKFATGKNHLEIIRSWSERYPHIDIRSYEVSGENMICSVLPCALTDSDLENVLLNTRLTAQAMGCGMYDTKALEAAVEALYQALIRTDKEEIARVIDERYGYWLKEALRYGFSSATVLHQSLKAFIEGHDYASCLSIALKSSGDVESVAMMTGALAAAYYPLPLLIRLRATRILPKDAVRSAVRLGKQIKARHGTNY